MTPDFSTTFSKFFFFLHILKAVVSENYQIYPMIVLTAKLFTVKIFLLSKLPAAIALSIYSQITDRSNSFFLEIEVSRLN